MLSVSCCFPQQPAYRHYNTSTGLPTDMIFHVMRDNKGYFWFASNSGILRFDGYGFQNFNTSDGLSDNEIYQVLEDRDGRIWFPCNNGELNYYEDDKFYNRHNSPLLSSFESSYIGLRVIEDDQRGLFFLTQKDIFVRQKNVFKKVVLSSNMANSTLLKNQKGEALAVIYNNEDVIIKNLSAGKNSRFKFNRALSMPRLNTKAAYSGENLFYASELSLVRVNHSMDGYTIDKIFDGMIQCIIPHDKNHLWIGTQKGLHLWDVNQKLIKQTWFKNSSISHVLTDNENNIWVTTLNDGIYMVGNREVKVLNKDNGLGFDNVTAFKVFDSLLAVGSNNFKYAFINAQGIRSFEIQNSIGGGFVKSFAVDANKNFYALTSVNMQKHTSRLASVGSYKTSAKDICFANDTVFIARTSGISAVTLKDFNLNLNHLEKLYYERVYKKDNVAFFYQDKELILHVGNSGVFPLNSNMPDPFKPDPKFTKNISCISRYGTYYLLASKTNGVKIVKGGHETILSESNGLASSCVTGMAFDNNKGLWVSTSNGLTHLIIDTLDQSFQVRKFQTIGLFNGIISDVINDVAFFNEEVWVATQKGICIIDPLKTNVVKTPPEIIFERVTFNDSAYSISRDEYVSNHNRSNLSIKFLGISSTYQNKILYQYRLVGIKNEWTTTQQTTLTYPRLLPGEYEFQIRSMVPGGATSRVFTKKILIIPAFYQELWFKALVAMIVIAIIAVIIAARIKAWKKALAIKQSLLESENKRLELEKEEVQLQNKLLELEQKALRLHMNPHFIFNAINAIHGFYSSGEQELAKRYITKFSQLLRMLLENSSQKFISIKNEEEMIRNYCVMNELRFQDKFTYEIVVDENINKEVMAIPTMILQPFVENAFIHGIAPLKTKGSLKIKIGLENDHILCEIEDNGIGLARSRELNNGRIHVSTGIKVTEERIKSFYKGKNMKGLEIIDLHEKHHDITGTLVKVRLDIVYLNKK